MWDAGTVVTTAALKAFEWADSMVSNTVVVMAANLAGAMVA